MSNSLKTYDVDYNVLDINKHWSATIDPEKYPCIIPDKIVVEDKYEDYADSYFGLYLKNQKKYTYQFQLQDIGDALDFKRAPPPEFRKIFPLFLIKEQVAAVVKTSPTASAVYFHFRNIVFSPHVEDVKARMVQSCVLALA